jgi:protein O-GlcNAc transferase
MVKVDVAIKALERGEQTISSIAKLCACAETDVALEVANQYWLWGEPERALPLLEDQLARFDSAPLQMAHLRCLISLADENRTAVKSAIANLQAILRVRVGAQAGLALPEVDRRTDRKLRLGFVCTYSNLKPVELSLVPMLRAIDRSRFHTSFFSLGQQGHPALGEVCDEHVVLVGETPAAACEAIRRRKVDVLFDLNGILREDFPVEIFGLRGAPVQAGWWNTPVSCGLDSVQYYFMDRSILTAANHDLFTETIVEIPGGATLCYELSDREPVAPAPYLTSRTFTFGSFTALFKTNDVVLDSWAQILARVPHTRLYIKAAGSTSERFRSRLARALERHAVDGRRIACEEVDTFDVMMARFAAVDMCLNTFNYGTGTTALNAVWQGVPTLTFNGSLHYARGTASMMVDCGLDDFVVPDREAYIQKAVRLAAFPARLLEVRPLLRDHIRCYSTWLSPERFVRNFEQACVNAWTDWRSNEAAASTHSTAPLTLSLRGSRA